MFNDIIPDRDGLTTSTPGFVPVTVSFQLRTCRCSPPYHSERMFVDSPSPTGPAHKTYGVTSSTLYFRHSVDLFTLVGVLFSKLATRGVIFLVLCFFWFFFLFI